MSEKSKTTSTYMLDGAELDARRLSLQHQALRQQSVRLLTEAGVRAGEVCLDLGCGGGDTTIELARLVGPTGHVTGVDADPETVRLARIAAEKENVTNVDFQSCDVRQLSGQRVDVVYARYLLSHLNDPGEMIATMTQFVRPSGRIVIEDLDASACFTHPVDESTDRFVELYLAVVSQGGGDPLLARRLPILAEQAGLRDVRQSFYQPAFTSGPFKHLGALTLERAKVAIVGAGVADADEVDSLVSSMHAFADRAGTLVALPRIAQVWGTV